MSKHHDAVIIGSGFGGSINALRLAEAGRSVLVLERGRRYPPKQFPRDVQDTNALLWRYPDKRASQGLYELRFMSGVASITAAGLGGGSLIYASIHYRPQARIFKDPRWPKAFNLDTLGSYYDKVSEALGVEPVPTQLRLPKRDAFVKAADAMGREQFDTPQAVSWNQVFGAGKGRKTCQLCAECEFGCPHGAKNTLDFTYLAKAQDLGAELATHANVSHIAPHPGGGWDVHYEDTRTGDRSVVTGARVIVAAGTLGSNEILLRSRDVTKTLPKLSARLGYGYSGNGDFLGNIQNAATSLEPWVGPDVTSVMWCFDQDPGFAIATPTFNEPVMQVLASLGQPPPNSFMRLVSERLYRKLPQLLPLAMKTGLLNKPLRRPGKGAGPASRFTTVFAIGQDNGGGRVVLRRGKLDVVWAYEQENRALVAAQQREMQRLANQYGGTYGNLATWDLFGRILTVHNLGGCALSNSADEGVVGIDGQVHGHAGLYVADGSVIPTAIGSHPAMTISAVAEWIAERVVASYA
ncbi:Cholesterol oxidase precursor [Enhygromyxa salina]|uniref:Cholesterol oxidase n=1 Tax=Enhygromyxa salina TaxID=215803 RepID=A0A0C2DDF6_9BACT|nr:GMC family oxidoreductase [Enhygromyxa salina]KIG19470.1 Cholesterol oxidase precursor [Enhygromyxa salina]